MKRILALSGSLLLVLALAAPAAANQRVWIESQSGPYVLPQNGATAVNLHNRFWTYWLGADWACADKDIYFQVQGNTNLWLWYPNSVDTTDPAEYMPPDRAWPWVSGEVKDQGVYSFFANADMTGRMVSAKYAISVNLSDHDITSNPETWTEQNTGNSWALNVPGTGPVIHESGYWSYTVSVTLPDKKDWSYYDFRTRGNWTYDLDGLCAYFGAGPVEYLRSTR